MVKGQRSRIRTLRLGLIARWRCAKRLKMANYKLSSIIADLVRLSLAFLVAAKEWVQPIAILVGGVWIASIWVHSNLYLPSQNGQFISIAPVVTKRDDNIRIKVAINNTSNVRAYNVSHYVAIYLVTLNEGEPTALTDNDIVRAARTVSGSSETFTTWGEVSSRQLVGFSTFHAPYNYYEPKEIQTYERIFNLSGEKFKNTDEIKQLEIELRFNYARCDSPFVNGSYCKRSSLHKAFDRISGVRRDEWSYDWTPRLLEIETPRGPEMQVKVPRCLLLSVAADGSNTWSTVAKSEYQHPIWEQSCDKVSAIRRPIGVVFTSAASLRLNYK